MSKIKQRKEYQEGLRALNNYNSFETKDAFINIYGIINSKLKEWNNHLLLDDLKSKFYERYLQFTDERTVEEKIRDYKEANPIEKIIRR